MRNRQDKSLRCALLKPGARIRRTLYRRYKADDRPTSPDREKHGGMNQKRASMSSGGYPFSPGSSDNARKSSGDQAESKHLENPENNHPMEMVQKSKPKTAISKHYIMLENWGGRPGKSLEAQRFDQNAHGSLESGHFSGVQEPVKHLAREPNGSTHIHSSPTVWRQPRGPPGGQHSGFSYAYRAGRHLTR